MLVASVRTAELAALLVGEVHLQADDALLVRVRVLGLGFGLGSGSVGVRPRVRARARVNLVGEEAQLVLRRERGGHVDVLLVHPELGARLLVWRVEVDLLPVLVGEAELDAHLVRVRLWGWGWG